MAPFKFRDSSFFLKLQLNHKARRTNLLLFMSSVCFAALCVLFCAQRLPYAYTCHKKNYVYTVLTSTDTPRSKVSDWFRKISGSVDRIQMFFLLIWWHKCCFTLVFIAAHADDECSVWNHQRTQEVTDCPLRYVLWSQSLHGQPQKWTSSQRDHCSHHYGQISLWFCC